MMILISVQIFLFPIVVAAGETFYSPGFCKPEYLTVEVENQSPHPQEFWTQVRVNQDIRERIFQLSGKSKMQLKASDFLQRQEGFSLKSLDTNSLKISVDCENTIQFKLNGSTSPLTSYSLPKPSKHLKVFLLNLFLQPNVVKLRAYDSLGQLIEEKKTQIDDFFGTISFKWNLQEPASHIEVESENRIHNVILASDKSTEKRIEGAVVNPARLQPQTNKNYFLVSTKEARPEESFVIAIDDPTMIETAREQIKNKNLEKIVVAGIQLGHGGYNRTFSSKDRSPYSWSVHRVDAFADFAHIDCDGSPDITEERLMIKLHEGGRICFWRYRVVRELSVHEVASGKLLP